MRRALLFVMLAAAMFLFAVAAIHSCQSMKQGSDNCLMGC